MFPRRRTRTAGRAGAAGPPGRADRRAGRCRSKAGDRRSCEGFAEGLVPENVGYTGAAAGADGWNQGGRYRPHGGHRRGRDGRRGRRGWACRGRRRGRCGRRGSGGCPEARASVVRRGFQRYEARQQGEVQEQQFQRGGRPGLVVCRWLSSTICHAAWIYGIELRREVQQTLFFRVRHVERGGGRGPTGLTDEEQVTPQRGQFAEEKPRSTPRSSNSCVSAATARQS